MKWFLIILMLLIFAVCSTPPWSNVELERMQDVNCVPIVEIETP